MSEGKKCPKINEAILKARIETIHHFLEPKMAHKWSK